MSLENICKVHAPSGCEWRMKDFILDYIRKNSGKWKVKPKVIKDNIKDNLVLVFGRPRNAVFCHMDTTGFTVRYDNNLIFIGSPDVKSTDRLRAKGDDGKDKIFKLTEVDEKHYRIRSAKTVKPGTVLDYCPSYSFKKNIVTSPYLDNRAGVWVCLELARTMKNGIIVFTAYEEHGGGSVEFLAPMVYHDYRISNAFICDMTWQSEAVFSGKGMVVSLRDKYIPRQIYLNKIIETLLKNKVKFQEEVEGSGASDGGYLQKSSVPFDWCFTGAAIGNMHSSAETADIRDLEQLRSGLEILNEKL